MVMDLAKINKSIKQKKRSIAKLFNKPGGTKRTLSPPYNSQLISWRFKPSQPQRIISGLKETFIKRYIAERINKAEIRPEEQSEKAESCRENLWNEIQFKGP